MYNHQARGLDYSHMQAHEYPSMRSSRYARYRFRAGVLAAHVMSAADWLACLRACICIRIRIRIRIGEDYTGMYGAMYCLNRLGGLRRNTHGL